jgi:hypothetical protein
VALIRALNVPVAVPVCRPSPSPKAPLPNQAAAAALARRNHRGEFPTVISWFPRLMLFVGPSAFFRGTRGGRG